MYELDKAEIQTGRFLGTVNLDSLEADAYSKLVGDATVRDMLEEKMNNLQDIVTKIAST